jgi:hypothetical protein
MDQSDDENTPAEIIAESQTKKPDRTLKGERKKRRSLSAKTAAIVDLTVKGNSPSVIAEIVDLPRQTVADIVKRFEPIFKELRGVADYRTVKSDILAAGQIAALKSAMSPKKLEKSSFLSSLQGFEILNKAERLDSGQATENVAHMGNFTVNHLRPGTEPDDN